MEDWLYTLMIIAWVGYGIYKGVTKNKKKPSQNQAQRSPQLAPEKSKVSSTIDGILSEFFSLPEQENDKIPHPYTVEKEEKIVANPNIYENYLKDEALDSYSGTDRITSVFEDEQQDEIMDPETNKDFDYQSEEGNSLGEHTVFDLRQAVIHQVILERPY